MSAVCARSGILSDQPQEDGVGVGTEVPRLHWACRRLVFQRCSCDLAAAVPHSVTFTNRHPRQNETGPRAPSHTYLLYNSCIPHHKKISRHARKYSACLRAKQVREKGQEEKKNKHRQTYVCTNTRRPSHPASQGPSLLGALAIKARVGRDGKPLQTPTPSISRLHCHALPCLILLYTHVQTLA